MEFKDRIKSLMIERGITRAHLAKILDKSESAIRAWEVERSKPDVDTLIILAKYFKCTTDYLLGLCDYRSIEEKKDISTLCESLESAITKVDSGKEFLESLVQFIELALQRNHVFIATAYLSIAKCFISPLRELFKLQDEFTETKSFNFASFADCYSILSTATTMSKKNVHLMSSYPLPWLMNLAAEYGSDIDEKLVKIFFEAYHNKGIESIPDLWSSTTEIMQTLVSNPTAEATN